MFMMHIGWYGWFSLFCCTMDIYYTHENTEPALEIFPSMPAEGEMLIIQNGSRKYCYYFNTAKNIHEMHNILYPIQRKDVYNKLLLVIIFC